LSRAPEVILGHFYDARIDIWSLGAVLAELHTGYVLFQNDSIATMLSRIIGILGPFPQHVLHNGKDTSKYFTLSNVVYERIDEGSVALLYPKKTNLAARLHIDVQQMDEEQFMFLDFANQLLHLDPTKRPTATELLGHPWLENADTQYIPPPVLQHPDPNQVNPRFSILTNELKNSFIQTEGDEDFDGDIEGGDEDELDTSNEH
jgi:serine/threonine protein kinase